MPDFAGVPLYRELEGICCLPGKEITGWGLTLLLESFFRVDFGFAVEYPLGFFCLPADILIKIFYFMPIVLKK